MDCRRLNYSMNASTGGVCRRIEFNHPSELYFQIEIFYEQYWLRTMKQAKCHPGMREREKKKEKHSYPMCCCFCVFPKFGRCCTGLLASIEFHFVIAYWKMWKFIFPSWNGVASKSHLLFGSARVLIQINWLIIRTQDPFDTSMW